MPVSGNQPQEFQQFERFDTPSLQSASVQTPTYWGLSGKLSEELSMSKIARFFRDESGATAIEYGLIAAGISVAIITVVGSLGSSLNTTFTSVQTALK
jgi:pilus assembly protein Flp/PilA